MGLDCHLPIGAARCDIEASKTFGPGISALTGGLPPQPLRPTIVINHGNQPLRSTIAISHRKLNHFAAEELPEPLCNIVGINSIGCILCPDHGRRVPCQPSIHPPIDQSINQSTNQSINQSTNQSTSLSINQLINQAIKQ